MAELTPEQIKLEQERLKLIQEQNEAAKELTSQYEKQKKAAGFLTLEEKEILNISKQLAKVTNDIDKSINTRLSGTASVKDLTKQLNSLTLNQLGANDELNKLQTEFTKKLDLSHQLKQKGLNLSIKQKIAEETLGQKASRVANLQNTIRTYQEQIISAQGRGDKGEVARLNNLKRRSSLLLAVAKDQEKDHKEDLKNINNEVVSNKKKYDVIKSQANVLQENKRIVESTIEEGKKEQELLKQAITNKKKEGVLDEIKKRLKIDEIKDMFTIAGLLKIIIDAALRFNATSVEIGKNIGYGANQADRVAQNLTQIANNSNDLNVTLKALGAAMSELNDATGGVAEYSADVLKTQVMLTKQFGLTGEEAAGIYKFSVLTGKASSQVNDEMVAAFANTRNAVKGSANFKKTMAEAAKVSGELAVSLKNNPAYITAAIVKAQALGTTLEQTKNQGSQLLDFESSISNELEAELMTGQQLNLEKARMFALTGDMVGLSQELANQGMTLNKFENMNVLARESYSKALGLNSDQLAEQLRKQKIAQEQGKSLAEITKEEALEAEKRQNVQDRFNAAIEKLQDFIGNLVAGPLGSMLDILSQSLDIVNLIVMPFQALYNLTSMIGQAIFGWVDKLGVVGKILKGIAGIAILYAAYSAYGALAGIPIVGPILGGIAAAAITAAGFGLLNTQKAGDMISPADGKTQVSTKEGGLFELSPNDDLLAGPGLAKGGGGKGESIQSNVSIDLTPMVNAINAVKTAIDKLYAKEGVVNIDGKKVGTLLTQGTYKTA